MCWATRPETKKEAAELALNSGKSNHNLIIITLRSILHCGARCLKSKLPEHLCMTFLGIERSENAQHPQPYEFGSIDVRTHATTVLQPLPEKNNS